MAQVSTPPPVNATEFLAWDDGTDTRYELHKGVIVAMAPPHAVHGRLVANIAALASNALRTRPPCGVMTESGVAIDGFNYFVADLVGTCGSLSEPIAPAFIVEVLSPLSTERTDLSVKAHAYANLASTVEMWFVASDRRWIQHWQREAGAWIVSFVTDGSFQSPWLAAAVAIDDVYANSEL